MWRKKEATVHFIDWFWDNICPTKMLCDLIGSGFFLAFSKFPLEAELSSLGV